MKYVSTIDAISRHFAVGNTPTWAFLLERSLPSGSLLYGCGSKIRYQNGTLVSGNMDQHLRNPSCLILSHTHMFFSRSPSSLSVLATPLDPSRLGNQTFSLLVTHKTRRTLHWAHQLRNVFRGCEGPRVGLLHGVWHGPLPRGEESTRVSAPPPVFWEGKGSPQVKQKGCLHRCAVKLVKTLCCRSFSWGFLS